MFLGCPYFCELMEDQVLRGSRIMRSTLVSSRGMCIGPGLIEQGCLGGLTLGLPVPLAGPFLVQMQLVGGILEPPKLL